jgi:hypothetical protein
MAAFRVVVRAALHHAETPTGTFEDHIEAFLKIAEKALAAATLLRREQQRRWKAGGSRRQGG